MDDIYDFEIKSDDPIFVIGVVSELVHIPIWTLRRLDDMGVVKAKRLGKKTRAYTKNQVGKLIYICHLMQEKGVNIQGIKVIMEIETKEETDDRYSRGI